MEFFASGAQKRAGSCEVQGRLLEDPAPRVAAGQWGVFTMCLPDAVRTQRALSIILYNTPRRVGRESKTIPAA